jgi:hypothetical protein
MDWRIYRNCDTLRLRKLVIELYHHDGRLIDRRRMFAFPFFNLSRRLTRKMNRMVRLAAIVRQVQER